VELRTFGGLAACSDSGPLEGAGTQKRRLALLALVDVAGERGITRDKLLSYLWADAEAEKARGALAQALYSLRKSLGSDELFLGTNEIRLNRAVLDSDRSRFLSGVAKGELEAAVAEYAGPFLDGFFLSDAVEFEIWIDAERASLAHKYVGALQQLAARAEQAGDVHAAVAWWRKLVNVDPLNGQLALGLIRALATAGDRAGAIQHARVYERLVQQELEVPGDDDVRAFVEELKRKPSPVVRAPSTVQASDANANANANPSTNANADADADKHDATPASPAAPPPPSAGAQRRRSRRFVRT
jgi:DNA-binding SARP family transcriptional activator